MEDAIAALLPPAATGAAARADLLARLAEYSAAAVREARALGPIVPTDAECARALAWLLRPIFICGHHRSGTTLLQSLLDGHPCLLTLPSEGTYFGSFPYVARRRATERDLDRFAAEWISRFVDPNREPHFRLGRSSANRHPSVAFVRMLLGWDAALRRRLPARFAALLALAAAYRQAAAPTSTPQAWVEKTPRNERHAGRFAFFTDARFIQIVREPRATLASLREAHRSADLGAFDAAGWARAIGDALRLAQANSRRLANRYLVVRYEDVVASPAAEIERVRSFLGIPSDPALLAPSADGRAVAPNSSFGEGRHGVIERFSRPDALPREHLELLAVYAGAPARRLGYPLPSRGPTARCVVRLRSLPGRIVRASRRVPGLRLSGPG